MKGFALIVCVFSLAVLAHGLTDEQKQKLRAIHKECQDDPATHVDEELLKKAYKGEDVNVGVHVLCMSKKLGFQKDNGDVDKAALKKKISVVVTDEAKLDEIVDKCGQQKATPEATAEHVMKCFHDNVGHVLHDEHHH